MNALSQRFRYRILGFADGPAFAVVSTLLLALGIGACAVIFSIVNAVLLRRLPYPQADRVVEVKQINPNGRRTNLCDVNFDAEVETAYE
jgi:hypothetical protein